MDSLKLSIPELQMAWLAELYSDDNQQSNEAWASVRCKMYIQNTATKERVRSQFFHLLTYG